MSQNLQIKLSIHTKIYLVVSWLTKACATALTSYTHCR